MMWAETCGKGCRVQIHHDARQKRLACRRRYDRALAIERDTAPLKTSVLPFGMCSSTLEEPWRSLTIVVRHDVRVGRDGRSFRLCRQDDKVQCPPRLMVVLVYVCGAVRRIECDTDCHAGFVARFGWTCTSYTNRACFPACMTNVYGLCLSAGKHSDFEYMVAQSMITATSTLNILTARQRQVAYRARSGQCGWTYFAVPTQAGRGKQAERKRTACSGLLTR